MKLFEYQAKAIFGEFGIPVPTSQLVQSAEDLDAALDKVGSEVVVKSQVLTGSRGKAGLIAFAHSRDQARKCVDELLKRGIRKLLVEQKLDIDREIYLSISVEPVSGTALIMACPQGGIDIEELAERDPGKIVKETVDTVRGLMPFQLKSVAFRLGLQGEPFKQFCKVLDALYRVFVSKDAEMVEINPLVVTRQGDMIAADGKLIIDDNAAFRQKGFELSREHYDSDLEYEAAVKGIPYVQFDGAIGLMCAGAGLTNTVCDLIHDFGGTVANFLEFGGPNYKRAVEAMELTLKNKPKAILIVTFGTIARADVMAEGIIEAKNKLNPQIPIVTAIRGTGEEKAAEILRANGLEPLFDTEQAVQRAVKLTAGAGK